MALRWLPWNADRVPGRPAPPDGEPTARLADDLAPPARAERPDVPRPATCAIQIALGWEDYHLHAFKAHGRCYSTEWTGQRHHVEDGDDLREVTLADLSLRLRQKILYEHDFGDF